MTTQGGIPRIRYLGWSAFEIETQGGSLYFDPAFTNLYGTQWAQKEDYSRAKVICVTHGHSDHYNDVSTIAKSTGSKVVSSYEVCKHLQNKRKIDPKQLLHIMPSQTIRCDGFNITAFEWRHREINFLRLLKADFLISARFAFMNLFQVPFNAPYFGYFIETPGGFKIMNYCEGFSNAMKIEEVQDLGRRYKIDVLLAGAQLNFEHYVSTGVEALAPKTVVLFHPHKAMFDRIGLKSSDVSLFKNGISSKLPRVKIVAPDPMGYISLADPLTGDR